jgi:hypothetical protein
MQLKKWCEIRLRSGVLQYDYGMSSTRKPHKQEFRLEHAE